MNFSGSKSAVEAGGAYVAGGVNSGFRTGQRPNPLVFTSAHGCRLVDVDGNELTDYFLGMGPMILGHSPASVIDAAKRQLDISLLVAGQTPLEYQAARIITELVPSAQLVRFASSGSEAVQVALRTVRAATGRWKIIKFEGHYHGWFDNVLWSVAPDLSKAGDALHPIPVGGTEGQEANDNFVVMLLNYSEILEENIKCWHRAGVLLEPRMLITAGVMLVLDFLNKIK